MWTTYILKTPWVTHCLAALGMLTVGATQASALDLTNVDTIFGAPACGDACSDTCTDTDCGDGCCLDSCLGGGDSGINFGGWLEYGYRSNSAPFDAADGSTDLNFNDNLTGFGSNQKQGLNQAWFYAEKVADGSQGTDWGFRFDLMYGLDADDTQAFGNPPGTWDYWNGFDNGIYGWAIPQLYGEIAMGDLSIIVGHFYTLVGYEVVTAPDNFFYSHAYTMFNSEPFTHTGALATYNVSNNVTAYGGWVAGWDTGFEREDGGSMFLGGTSVGLGDNVTATYILTAGNAGARADKGYSHSVVLDVVLTEDLNYVFQTDLVDFENDGAGDHQLSINQYLFYTLSDKLAAGVRAEWWKTGGAGNTGGIGPVSVYEVTAGLNIKPLVETDCNGQVSGDWLIIRPEIRHDWTPDLPQGVTFPDGSDSLDYTTFGIDAIVTF